eukprot:CAMPEP_0185541198 /NCGR_PEP_ID=MMETSP1381-20130426/1797_1 /TAXON_ID=298111 /ORGANISM="Pavlova sp., Strain CCMP459" /LENGTH=99 /DNA_ID=CAMNT_0028153101 /DNA_START=221 /DNA_END=517 /DNA_ORIENTATION=+
MVGGLFVALRCECLRAPKSLARLGHEARGKAFGTLVQRWCERSSTIQFHATCDETRNVERRMTTAASMRLASRGAGWRMGALRAPAGHGQIQRPDVRTS